MPPSGLKRGGARNRANRVSFQLTERHCRLLLDGSFDAWQSGLPLNRFVTVAWGLAGVEPEWAVLATGQFVSKARDWLRGHGFPMPWVWVQERGKRFGQHAHILLHVPAEIEPLFRPMPRRWVKAILGGSYVARTIDTQRLAPAYSCGSNPELYRAVLMGKLHYMMKCAPEALEKEFAMCGWGHKPWGQSSKVCGKRAGAWQRGKYHAGEAVNREATGLRLHDPDCSKHPKSPVDLGK